MSDLPPNHSETKFLDSHFLNPDRSNLEALRKLGYDFVDLIVDSVLDTQTQPCVADKSPFDINIPEQGIEI